MAPKLPEELIDIDSVDGSIRTKLEEYLASGSIPPASGAKALTDVLIHRDDDGRETILPIFFEFWEAFLRKVYQSSDTELQKLAELTIALSKLEVGESMTKFGTSYTVWDEMPQFEWTIDDQMRGGVMNAVSQHISSNKGEPHGEQAIAEAYRLNCFTYLAYLQGPWDFRKYGLAALTSALECDTDYEDWLPVAYLWIDQHGEQFLGGGWNVTREYDPRDVEVAPGPLRNYGHSSMSKERWDFWTGRLQDLQSSQGISVESKALAKRMAERMAHITKDLKSDDEDDNEDEDDE